MKQWMACLVILGVCAAAQGADDGCAALRARTRGQPTLAAADLALARCAAGEGDVERAYALLGAATGKGYHDLDELRADVGLVFLHADPRWANVVLAVSQRHQRYLAGSDAELLAMYQADQADRQGANIDWAVVTARDKARQVRVQAMADAARLVSAADFYHAAMVFQHGSTPEFHLQAHQWALRATALDPHMDEARWLACASEDRYLWGIGKPQIWGTQFTKPFSTKVWTMEPFERGAKTDAERMAMNVKVLAESEARLQAMNAPASR